MNKSYILSILVALMCCCVAGAVPAWPGLHHVQQPDGSRVTLQIVGDEYFNYVRTSDGFTVVRTDEGAYEYATLRDGVLVASGVVAHDQAQRTVAEQRLLAELPRNLFSREQCDRGRVLRAKRDALGSRRVIDYAKFRGLVVLVEPSDVAFLSEDPVAFYDDMINTEGFTGYHHPKGTDWSLEKEWVDCTGSVRDYYEDNSMGIFKPVFDVVGPVKVNRPACDFGSNSYSIFMNVVNEINPTVDFSKYDVDNNGKIDLVFFLVAGTGANSSHNDSGNLWPHRSSFYTSAKFDGKDLRDYACTTELLYDSSYSMIDGIGSFCHEFSHVLGLADHYDTDDASSGGGSQTPGEWDIMAGGNYLNYSITPAGYSIFERHALGFGSASVISQTGSYQLGAVNEANHGYILTTPVTHETFMLENRQQAGWDQYLPGHGMLIWRVDSTDVNVWNNNTVNVDPSHNYLELLRAGNSEYEQSASDPFPGTLGVTHITNDTYPCLRTWDKMQNKYNIVNIREANGIVTFDVVDNGDHIWSSLVETFEGMPVMTASPTKGVEGVFTTWDFVKSFVKEPGSDYCTGTKAVEMVYPSLFSMAAPIYYNIQEVSYDIYNTSSITAKMGLAYSLDEGATWTKAKNVMGSTDISVPALTRTSCNWLVPVTNKQAVQIRVVQNSSSKTVPVYVDNFTVYYTGEQGGPGEGLKGDVNGDGSVDISDVNAVINIMLGKAQPTAVADFSGDGIVDITDVNGIINIMLGKK